MTGLRILYVQAIELDADLCRTSRIGLSQALADLGCRVTLVAGYGRRRPEPPPGVDLRPIWLPHVPYVRAAWYALAAHAVVFVLLASRSFDVVVVDPYSFHAGWPFDWMARVGLKQTRFVLDVRSGIFHVRTRALGDVLRRAIMRAAFGYARAVFAGFTTISPMLRDTLATEYGVPRVRIGIWESAVSAGFGVAPGAGSAVPLIPADRFVVLYHGSFGPDRGLPETVEAMRLLQTRRPEALLVMLGSGTEEPALRMLAQGLDNVWIVPPVPHEQVPDFIDRCDVGILPFRPTPVMRSSRPLKLIEYLTLGKPVIVSRIEVFTTVLDDHAAIYLADQTPSAIADAIVEAWERQPQLAAAAWAARTSAAGTYTWRHQAETLCKFLTALP